MKDTKKRLMDKEEALEKKVLGMMDARPGIFRRLESLYSYALYKNEIDTERVQIIANGGGGYGPLFLGFLGEGLADATCEGNFDTAPNAYALYDLAKTLGGKKGVLMLSNHFAGDFLNNDMAQELLETEGIACRVCYARDDIFSAKGEGREKRGGLSGIGMLIKIAARAACMGMELDEIYQLVERANKKLCSLSFLLDEQSGEIEFGTGFSGEPAAKKEKIDGTPAIAKEAVSMLLDELEHEKQEHLYLMVNRMCQMSCAEGYGILHDIKKELQSRGYAVAGCACGQYLDAFDENGAIISLLSADAELQNYMQPVCGYDFVV